MSALDTIADKARAKSEQLAAQGGLKARLAEELADDAEFLRKLKPELIRKRVRGEAPTDGSPTAAGRAPAGAQPARRPKPGPPGAGPNPFVVLAVALAAGVALAKWLDWRGHAHPR